MKILKKLLTWLVLPLCIVGLGYIIVQSIMQPVNFNKEKDYREGVAIQRLKDIRTLQVAFKSVYNRFSPTVDSLVDFYNTGKIDVVLQLGDVNDSVQYEHTQKVKAQIARAAKKKLSDKDMQLKLKELYDAGDKQLIVSLHQPVAANETLFTDREDFVADSLKYIPFSGKAQVLMESTIKKVSGVDVPLFEAKIPYAYLLKGMDKQLIVNLVHDRMDQDKFEGLQVGSITAPNNNAGNWE